MNFPERHIPPGSMCGPDKYHVSNIKGDMMNEQKFRWAWKVLWKLWLSEHNHCLVHGCGRDTLAGWVRKVCNAQRKAKQMSHKYEIVNVDTGEVLERVNDLGLAQEETDALNARGKNYILCNAGTFSVPDWPWEK